MIRTLGAFLIVAGLGCVPGAKAAGTNVKCAMNEDRVWVYESVVDFNLAAKLKCGEPVEIIGRVKGYVKVQTQAGVEGYVADSAFPKSALPPEPAEKPNDVESASVAALAHHSALVTVNATNPPAAATVASIAPAGSNPSSPASSVAANSTSVMTANANVSPAPAPVVSRPRPAAVAPKPAPQPALVANASPTAAPAASASPVTASPQPPTVAPAAKAPPVIVASAPTVSAPAVPASQPAELEITLSTAPTVSSPAPAPVSAPAVAASAPPAKISQPPSAPAPSSYVSNASNAAAADRAGAAPSPVIQPVSDSVVRPASPAANPDEDEDTAVRVLENENAGCNHFFSAYGLSPNQYKWLAQNRKKAFPSVCPAPTPAMVDFVVIFTHDVAFYNVTMPAAVHVDHNGFSDWTPMSTVDTALMTQSEANSSHHEYVWVFQTSRGAFDPAKFSSKRKPLFSKGETNMLGSHGGYKTVMDALTYIESNGTNR